MTLSISAGPFGGEQLIADSGRQSAIAALTSGDFVVVWATNNDGVTNSDVWAQRLSPSGEKIGPPFLADTTTDYLQFLPDVAPLSNGGFVVAWDRLHSPFDGDSNIFGQVFDAAGNKTGVEFPVNTTTFQAQDNPSIASLANGNFVVAWTDDSGHPGLQVFGPDGTKIGTELSIHNPPGFNAQVRLAALASGGFGSALTRCRPMLRT